MKLEFEKWLDRNDISVTVKNLFEESVICYKVSAYRSAYIMSYIAFQTILKERILNAPCKPSNIPDSMWDGIESKLQDDDVWDKEVFECVTKQKPNHIFSIPDSVKKEAEYNKIIRNKCAHGKNGKIESYHVESFWNFIQENFYRFVVNGSVNGIIQQIQDYFNEAIKSKLNCSDIVSNIKVGILENEYLELLKDIAEVSREIDSSRSLFYKNNKTIEFWDALIKESDAKLQNHILKFIETLEIDDLCYFVDRYPSYIEELFNDEDYRLSLIQEKLYEITYKPDGFWKLVHQAISMNLYNDEKLKSKLFKKIGTSFSEDYVDDLKSVGYFEWFESEVLGTSFGQTTSRIEVANINSGVIRKYLKCIGITDNVVSYINHMFSFADRGDFYDMIVSYMSDENNLNAYINNVTNRGITNYSEKFIK